MGFNNYYEKKIGNANELRQDPGGKCNILPFFGFVYKFEKREEAGGVSGVKTTLELNDSGGYDVKESLDFYDEPDSCWRTYSRVHTPSKEQRILENRFLDAYPKASYDPFETPYLYPSETEFYKCRGADMLFENNFLRNIKLIKKAIIIFGAVSAAIGILALIILQGYVDAVDFDVEIPRMVIFAISGAGSIVPAVCAVLAVIVHFIQKSVHAVRYKRFDELTRAQRTKIRKAYLASLDVGDSAANQILVEYAQKFILNPTESHKY